MLSISALAQRAAAALLPQSCLLCAADSGNALLSIRMPVKAWQQMLKRFSLQGDILID